MRVEIVEHEEVDTAVAVRVRFHITLDGRGREERPLLLLHGNVDEREGADLLRLSVLEHLEIVRRQVPDRIPVGVGDEGINLHVVHLDAEGNRRSGNNRRLLGGRLRRGLLRLRRRLLRGQRGGTKHRDDG